MIDDKKIVVRGEEKTSPGSTVLARRSKAGEALAEYTADHPEFRDIGKRMLCAWETGVLDFHKP